MRVVVPEHLADRVAAAASTLARAQAGDRRAIKTVKFPFRYGSRAVAGHFRPLSAAERNLAYERLGLPPDPASAS